MLAHLAIASRAGAAIGGSTSTLRNAAQEFKAVVYSEMLSHSARVAGHQRPPSKRAEIRTGTVARGFSRSLILPLFVFSLALPIMLYAGPIRLTPYQLFLLAFFIPCIVAWLSGRLGKIRVPDVLILLCSVWMMLTLMLHHGWAIAWQTSGALFLETFGAYLLARKIIRTQEDFIAMVRTLFWTVCLLLPFALIEFLTDRKLFLDVLGTFADTLGGRHMDPRHGFYRAQVAFEHPILYGVFCASAFGLVYYVVGFGKPLIGRLLRTLAVAVAAILSLSSGAITALLFQSGLVVWDRVMRSVPHRWLLLGVLSFIAYVAVDILSNRTPFHVFVSYLTLNPYSGYGRILLFEYGFAEVMRNPVFGIGFNDWERPYWLGSSMDNFWLVIAMMYGLPAFISLAGALLLIMKALGRAKLDSEPLRACRAGVLVSLGGLAIAACTVHYWNAIFVWFMFLMGSGVWMLDGDQTRGAGARESGRAGTGDRGRHGRQFKRAQSRSARTSSPPLG